MSICLRLSTQLDAPGVLGIYSPIVEHTATSFELEVPSLGEIAQRIGDVTRRAPWLACEEDGEVIGYAYAVPFRGRPAYAWSMETSVYVRADQRRRNIARALYTALLGCLRVQGFHMAVAGITLPNEASVAFHEDMGFQAVGVFSEVGHKHGAWHGVGFWQLILQALPEEPPPTLGIDAAQADPAWKAALREGEALVRGPTSST